MSLSFPAGASQLSDLTGSIIIITGVGRSGKTLVGNILGSCLGVEHLDEPWLPKILPIMAVQGEIAEELAIELFQTSLVELWYDRLLMRHVNFRPADRSSIWRQKTPEEILSRLVGLYSRDDVRQYARENHPSLVLNMPDTLPYLDFFSSALPGCRVIHVIREGLDVAAEVAEKGWLADNEFLVPMNAGPCYPYSRKGASQTYYLPFWVEAGEEDRFLGFSEYERGLYYWHRMLDTKDGQSNDRTALNPLLVKLTDLLNRPEDTVPALIASLGFSQTELTLALLSKITPEVEKDRTINPKHSLDPTNLKAVLEVYKRFDLPTQDLCKLLTTDY